MSREEAVTHLQSLGVTLGHAGDYVDLKRATILASRTTRRIYSPERQCTHKKRHASEEAARRWAKRNIGNPFVAAYFCGHCCGWHNGNPPRSRGLGIVR